MRISDLIASLQRTMATMGDLEVDATVSVVMIEPVLDEMEVVASTVQPEDEEDE